MVHGFNPRLDSLILEQKNQELKITSTTFGVQGSPELFPITWNYCCLTHGDIDKGRNDNPHLISIIIAALTYLF